MAQAGAPTAPPIGALAGGGAAGAPTAPAVDGASPAGDEDELALLPPAAWEGWLALLHYRRSGGHPDGGSDGSHGGDHDGDDGDRSGGGPSWRSEVPAPAFFLDEQGREDPEREWRADRRAFLLPAVAGAEASHAQCRFPARFAFMKAQLGWRDAQVPRVACAELDAFERKLDARSLAVVFASYFLANPASAFGHTMLYVGSAEKVAPGATQLADSSIGFEADTRGLSALGYVPKGLAGGLTAGFRVKPFHERVLKYERQELRDIWLFPLAVTRDELAQLVRHTWELRDVSYQYGFFGENCAQKILAIVHAVAPRYRLLPFPRAAVLPADVVRRLVTSIGQAGPPVLRRSLLGRYERARAGLGEAERAQLQRMIATRSVPADASAGVLAAALLWSELELPFRTFRRAAEATSVPGEAHPDLRWKRALLAARTTRGDGAAGGPGGELDAWRRSDEPSLLDGHAPSRLIVRGGLRDEVAALGAGARWLLHEPLDPEAGYAALSALEVLRVDAGVTAEGAAFLDEATALRLEKLAPASALQSPLVWRIELGARRLPYEVGRPLHAGAELAAGLGQARVRPGATVAAYALVGVRPGVAFLDEGARLAPAALATAGLYAGLGPLRARLHGESSLALRSRTFEAAVTATARLRLSRDLDLELAAAAAQDRALTASLGLVIFR
jgi:hypothetical protein